jgi:tetratricopeptide (TPR) repeat protein
VMRMSNDWFACLSSSQRTRGSASGKPAFWRHLFASALLVVAKTANAMPPDEVATLLKTATDLQQQGDYVHCIPILRRIIQTSPRSYAANLLLGEDLLLTGNIKDAVAPLQTASEARPEDGTAQVYLAQAAARLGDFSMAAEALRSARARSGETEQILVAWARFSLNRFSALGASLHSVKEGEGTELRFEAAGRPEGSEAREALLQESASAGPEQRGIWGELGLAQLETGKVTQAQKSLIEAQRRDPQGPETLRLEALFAGIQHHWSDAERQLSELGSRSPTELRRALAFWPRSLVPGPEVTAIVWDCLRNNAATCPLTSAQPQGGKGLSARDLYAEGRWEQLVALPAVRSADHVESLWRGVAFAKTGDCPRAIPSLEAGSKADLGAAGFWLKVCYASEIEQTAALLRTKQDEAAIHELNGDVMLQLHGDAEAAQKQYTQALKSRPKDPHLLAKLANADMRLGDVAQTKTAARAALAIDPHESSALQTLALTAMSERDYAEALVQLRQLVVISPKDGWTQVQLGVAYGQLGHPEEALHYLGPELSAGYPDPKGSLHAMLASALRKMGRDVEAKKAAMEAARLASLSLESGEHGNSDAPQ